jgi:hypothetical protein
MGSEIDQVIEAIAELDSRKRRVPQFGRWGEQLLDGRGYVRAYTRKGSSQQDIHWRAILVENVRVDSKPTQRHIAYLAGFTDSAVATPAQQRYLWDRITERLDRLSNRITPKDRRHIEAILIKKIGRPPTKAQRAKLDRERERILGSFSI